MKPTLKLSILAQSLGVMFTLSATAAFGQATPPDAGSLMNTTKEMAPAAPPKAPTLDVQQTVRPALVTPGGATVKVESFKVTGSTAFTSTQLEYLLAGYVGKDLDLAGLDEAAGVISQFYRSRGYFVARAYLPAQEVAGGNLEIAVVEGRLGAIKFTPAADVRLSKDVAEMILNGAAPVGAPINENSVERGLMLLNDLPGVSVKSTLVPGATPGTSDLVVETTEGGLLGGSVDMDNYGSKFTGSLRVGATLNLNDVSGNGDQVNVRAMTSGKGMTYGRVAYSLPVGQYGTKVGVAGSAMSYTLGSDFAALNAKGKSDVASIYAVQPFLRSRNNNVYGTISFDGKNLNDEQLGKNRTDKSISVWALGLSGDSRDGLGGGGMNTGSLTFTSGKLDLSGNADDLSHDIGFPTPGPQTNGNYSKIGYSLARLQRVDDDWSVYASLSGQRAGGKNLDSSEKFTLGGLGVRAYPQGEAAGDSGNLLNLEARYNMGATDYGNLQLSGFYDKGSVTLHSKTWTGWQPVGRPGFPNSYSISGMGVGVNLSKDADYSIRASLAWKLGSNPGADAAGRDSDNNDRSARFWLQATKQF